jgi:hypothetical protein
MSKVIGLGFVAAGFIAMYGCASKDIINKTEYDPAPIGKIVWSSDEKRPGWSLKQKEYSDGEKIYFIGMSEKMPTESTARSMADVDGRAKASKYISSLSRVNETNKASISSRLGKTPSGTGGHALNNNTSSETLFSGMNSEDWYITMYSDGKGGEFWQAFTLMSIPVTGAEGAVDFKRPKEEPVKDIGNQGYENGGQLMNNAPPINGNGYGAMYNEPIRNGYQQQAAPYGRTVGGSDQDGQPVTIKYVMH